MDWCQPPRSGTGMRVSQMTREASEAPSTWTPCTVDNSEGWRDPAVFFGVGEN